ncbi:2-dehydropantoate 2-reductase [Chloroflexi bacterium TSY]|nr:2-dehydropantoate 2-reductase [Chloroflexi bacterium TSY]
MNNPMLNDRIVNDKLNILVVGAGAIGCFIGGKLAQCGHRITLVGRSSLVNAVQNQKGLRLENVTQSIMVEKIQVADSIMNALAQSHDATDLVILTVKSYDTATTLDELIDAYQDANVQAPTVLSLQNGVGNEEIIASKLSPARVIAGIIMTPVTVPKPGVVVVEKPDDHIGLSVWHPAVAQALFNTIHNALDEAGFSVSLYEDPKSLKWTKLLMNMIGNASSAIMSVPPAEVFAEPQLANMEIDAWREALLVMRKSNIAPINIGNYSFGIFAPLIRTLPKILLRPILQNQIIRARGSKMPSLYLDLNAGKSKSEIQWLNGAVVRQGKSLGIQTPINAMLTDTLQDLVERQQNRELWHKANLRMIVSADEYRERVRKR